MLHIFDMFAIIAARTLACLSLLLLVVTAGALLLDYLLRRAGYVSMFLKFSFQEHAKSPREFAARLLWGRKESGE